ncbi:MAG: NAD(+)/NADH kinase [Verrucomicrobia bacterium]|nr:NAD(+)/NADH kinase [Verrucomicrobiota bacterium]
MIGWGSSSRVLTLGLSINDEIVTSYICDGLMISTPTGSTGHSLSAGGPILHPQTPAFIINVICPHTLSTRPLVVPDDSTITIHVMDMAKDKKVILAVDGQEEQPFEEGDKLVVKKTSQGVRFIHLPGYSYFEVLRHKLHWRGSNV